jgi:hypothetical protein
MYLPYKIRNSVAPLLLKGASFVGRYSDWTAAERQQKRLDAVAFKGDIPAGAGSEYNQYRVGYVKHRPLVTIASDVLYSSVGMAWAGKRLERRYSFRDVGLRELFERPESAGSQFVEATLLQAQTPYTFGDWVSEHLPLISAALEQGAVVEPLLLPAYWNSKSYVKRDLLMLGLRAVSVSEPTRIDRAVVLNKTRPGHYWTRQEVDAVLRAMRMSRPLANVGSAVYLSRFGQRGEGPRRQINNLVTEAAMALAGVRVVRTASYAYQDYLDLAMDAETVFADHGGALGNIMHWRTKRVIEFFAPNFWTSAFLFLADSLGIYDYHLWQIDMFTTVDVLAERVRKLLNTPICYRPVSLSRPK